MKTVVLAAVAWLLVAGDPAGREREKYQGTWALVSEEFAGKPVPPDKRPEISLTVRGDKVLFTSNGEERSAFVERDPTKDPRTYDLLRGDGFVSLRAIYAWDGDDTIKICAADHQGERPTEFKTAPGSPNRIRVWKRKKPG
jgi:uncharacterized protein (TIGR03067 family)